MAKLNTKQRNAMDDSEFALPNRKYPIEDLPHARAALSRVSQFGNERERTIVRNKVKNRFPAIAVTDK